ncbi:MAG TPA: c-type cytochrome [Vicinamibacterales bacterium]|nr:c-type cytochrome [Vicinamibacterales bacterium]
MDGKHRLLLLVVVCTAFQLFAIRNAFATEPATIFNTKCSSCHTFGKGIRVGPDLKGVTDRHPRPWLIAWIKSSDTQIRRGDPAAVSLFRQFRQQRMPDHDLSDTEIGALLDYLKAGGPSNDEDRRLRLAAEATPDDVRLGRRLFVGDTKLASGSMACVFCHTVSIEPVRGGTIGPNLSEVYARYWDWALDQRLKRPCLTSGSGPSADRVVNAESFALRAFLRAASSSELARASGK